MLDVTKINDLGWKSNISLKEGLKRTILSYKEEICEWLSSLDCVIGPASSVVYECHLAGIPYLCTDTITESVNETINAEPILERFYKLCKNPENIDDMLKQLSDLPNSISRDSKSYDEYSLDKLFEYNENSIQEIVGFCLNDFSRKKDYLYPFKNIILRIIDIIYILYHHIFRKHRLLLDFSFFHHSKYLK